MIEHALARLGRDAATRTRVIELLQAFERLPEYRWTTVRDDVTGPVVDALHSDVEVIRKELSNGLIFEFLYRSKIARDFVMSTPSRPDHVWEPQTTRLLVHLARNAKNVLIGGAYFGDQAVIVAHAMRESGMCHAFEADAQQASMLQRNAALNGLQNVRVDMRALWSDSVSHLQFVGHDAVASMIAAESGVPTTTIDDYAESRGIERFDLIMLDLEGGELPVLRGAERQLRAHGPHLIFEVHRAYTDWSAGLHNTELVRYLSALGYTALAIRDFQSNYDLSGRPIELVPVEHAYLDGPPHGFNVLAVKDTAVISGTDFRIVPGVSPKLLLHRDPRLHHPTGGL